ncbi:SpoIIE family protein phosphatase [Streptomyces sp. PTM05]|uniref:SpoIIE family protein phosphatase n=1 Tax=Streptantibioticus parmotrematis TaxID=2873249 RepID=A0ABS7R0T6_9ACTN|nr:GAF domain-containing SpoIIE family protein phosphatase [Streptantibioticus parmotrematis]MBY8889077.1 SpoIIE family protein phosphatase [Streptantibioticus parmotrematis]
MNQDGHPGRYDGPDDTTDDQPGMRGLLDAVLSISRELDLPVVLRRIVSTAMTLVGAHYGALGVLDDTGEELAEFITAGLDDEEIACLDGVELPRGRGLLGRLISDPRPLRVECIPDHPGAVGFPPGHPPMRTLLGVAIAVRGTVYGNLYLTDKAGGKPFDAGDEAVVTALAGAAGIAIENARLYGRLRAGAERFQRLLLPSLPDLSPFRCAAVYRPAASPSLLGGDWYDAMTLPDGSRVLVVGDVVGHDLDAAATMAQVRNMLRALVHDGSASPATVLARLDSTLHAVEPAVMATVCLVRLEPALDGGWLMRWSNAGHPPPLVLSPDGAASYPDAPADLPIGVDTAIARRDHALPLAAGSTLAVFTDGLIEHPGQSIEEGLRLVADAAAAAGARDLDVLCEALVAAGPGDGHDDLAILALGTPRA